MANYPYAVPAEQAFMGKARTYSEPTQFRQYAVRLRALKENPRNPAELGAIGPQGDWAVDDPSAIVEEGSNSNGGYVITANGFKKMCLTPRAYYIAPTTISYAHIMPIGCGNLDYRVTLSNHSSFIGGFNSYNCPLGKTNLQFDSVWQKQGCTGATLTFIVESDD